MRARRRTGNARPRAEPARRRLPTALPSGERPGVRALSIPGLCLLLVACSGTSPSSPPRPSLRDAGRASDAQATDGFTLDAGEPGSDAGLDAGGPLDGGQDPGRDATVGDDASMSADASPDAGPSPDTGPAGDAATPRDAGSGPDAASPDAASPDSGTALDAGTTPDAGPGPDAGDGRVELTLLVQPPAGTPRGDTVYVAGDFQAWNPADPAHALVRRPDGDHQLVLRLAVGQTIEFKFTRGGWPQVEKDAAGAEIMNRSLTVTGAGTQVFRVARWADHPSAGRSLSGDVQEHSLPGFLGGRRLWVYRPPSYLSDPNARFPVLYMLDGQNVFDASTSFSGEWGVDEALESLIPTGDVKPLIVVAIDNGGGSRLDEYTPWRGTYQGSPAGGGGITHLTAIVDTLKPWVDANFRTRPGPADTGFSGSSLGGLMSVYAAYARPDVFGRIGALSPSIWWSNQQLVAFVNAEPKPAGVRLWVDMGTQEGSISELPLLAAALRADGFVDGQDLRVVEVPGGTHIEAAWRARFPDVLRFLFPGP